MGTSTTVTKKKVPVDNETLIAKYTVERRVTVESLADLEKNEREELEREFSRSRFYMEERILQAARVRQAMMILDGVPGVNLTVGRYNTAYFCVNLGFFPQTRKVNRLLADTLRAIRKALGTSLGKPSMDLGDADTRVVAFTFTPADWPGVNITFYRRMPRGQKCRCKIVTERSISKRLVCEVTPR
jgi:hypothetical protein